MRKAMLILLVLAASLLAPKPAKAEDCGSLICLGQIFGWTDAEKINADASIKKADQERQKQIEVAHINAARDEAIKKADADIERQRQAGLIAQSQAQALADSYRAQADAWAQTQQKLISEKYETQRDAITQQTSLGLESIRQVGETERISLKMSTILDGIVLLAIFVLAFLILNAWQKRQRAPVMIVQQQRPTLDQQRYQMLDAESYQITKGHEQW